MMKSLVVLLALVAFSFTGFAQVNKMVGKWKTIDDNDGSTKSIVVIFKATNGKYYGKIEKLFKDPEKLCTNCEGAYHNKPILGMMIINNLVESNDKLSGGTITDPKNGKVYKCSIYIDSDRDILNVRGSLDRLGIVGRTQNWIRYK